MSTKFLNTKILIILFIIISSSKALKVKINGRQKDYCFTKLIYENEDTMKIFFLISSGKTEQLNVAFKNKEGNVLYQEVNITETLKNGSYPIINFNDKCKIENRK